MAKRQAVVVGYLLRDSIIPWVSLWWAPAARVSSRKKPWRDAIEREAHNHTCQKRFNFHYTCPEGGDSDWLTSSWKQGRRFFATKLPTIRAGAIYVAVLFIQ